MIIAIPFKENRLDPHFGHAAQFAFITIDEEQRQSMARRDVAAPPHVPGALPKWIREQGADLVIAGGMGGQAQKLLTECGVEVVLGAPEAEVEALVSAWLDRTLITGNNRCDH